MKGTGVSGTNSLELTVQSLPSLLSILQLEQSQAAADGLRHRRS